MASLVVSRYDWPGSGYRLGRPPSGRVARRCERLRRGVHGLGGAGPHGPRTGPHYRAARPVTAPAGRPLAVPMGSRSPCRPTSKALMDPSAALRA